MVGVLTEPFYSRLHDLQKVVENGEFFFHEYYADEHRRCEAWNTYTRDDGLCEIEMDVTCISYYKVPSGG